MKGRKIKSGSSIGFKNHANIHVSRYIHPKGVVICEDNRLYDFIYLEAIVDGRLYDKFIGGNNNPTPRETTNMCRKFLISIIDKL